MNKTTAAHSALDLIYTTDFIDFCCDAVSFWKWKSFIFSNFLFSKLKKASQGVDLHFNSRWQ